MVVKTSRFKVKTKGHSDIIDITSHVSDALEQSGLRSGITCVFCAGSTAAISTIEYESGLIEDICEALDKIASYGKNYSTMRGGGATTGPAMCAQQFLGLQ